MTIADPELLRLLVQELDGHLAQLEAWASDPTEAKRALHALRGSAGLAGERELAAALERLERRLRQDDEAASADAKADERTALQRLAQGVSAGRASLPGPPEQLGAHRTHPHIRSP